MIKTAEGSDLETKKIKLLLNKRVTKLNVEDHSVMLDDGSVIYYNKVNLHAFFFFFDKPICE